LQTVNSCVSKIGYLIAGYLPVVKNLIHETVSFVMLQVEETKLF